jgi:hypothetical protein
MACLAASLLGADVQGLGEARLLGRLEGGRLCEDTEDEHAPIAAMDRPSFRLQRLKGDLKGFWAVTVRASRRIVFRFTDGRAFDVDLVDYH